MRRPGDSAHGDYASIEAELGGGQAAVNLVRQLRTTSDHKGEDVTDKPKPEYEQLELPLFTDEGVIEPNVEAAHPVGFLTSIPNADDWYSGMMDALIHGKGIVPLPEGGLEVTIDYTSAVGE